MGEIRESALYLQSEKETKRKIQEESLKMQKEEELNRYLELESLKEAKEKRINEYHEYKKNVKKTLLTEALLRIYDKCIYNPTIYESALCESFLGQYINDTGVDNLLKKFKYSNNGFLRKINECVEKYYKKITEDSVPDDPTTQVIDKDNVEDFWKEIDDCEDVDDATNIIRLRVSNAEEDFVNKNHQDKENVETILKDTATRIQNAKANNDNDYSEEVEESETRIAKDKIYKLQHEGRTNVFDRMVRSFSEVALKSNDLKNEFIDENGRLNVDKVVDVSRCAYTLLEMVSTLGIEDVDQKYIEDTLKSIK